jgi:hypothetical protein
MKKKNQILIIPLTFWSGIEQGFQGFVTCASLEFAMYLAVIIVMLSWTPTASSIAGL